MDNQPFAQPRDAALALLAGNVRLTRKAGAFLGQIIADPGPLSAAQRDWMTALLDRAELPALKDGGSHG